MGPGAREERGQRGTSPRGDGHTASQSCGGSTGHPRAPYSPPNPTLLPHSPAEMLQRGRVQLPVFSAGCRMRLRALCLWGGWRDRLVIRGRDTGPSPAGVPKLVGQTPAPTAAQGIGKNWAVFSLPKSASPRPSHGHWVLNPKGAGCKPRGAEEPRNGLQPLCPCQAKLHAPTLQKSQQSPVPTATDPPGPSRQHRGDFAALTVTQQHPHPSGPPPKKGGLAGPAAGLQEVPGAYIRWLRATHPSTTGRGPNPCVPPSVTALLTFQRQHPQGAPSPSYSLLSRAWVRLPNFFLV